jgi:hypothetical protein
MADSVPAPTGFDKVAVAARLRTVSATPPSPAEGGPPFNHALPNWLLNVAPLGADVLHTNLTVLPLTAADWVWVEPPSGTVTRVDSAGRRLHETRATADAYRRERLPSAAPRSRGRAREARIDTAWTQAHALCLALHRLGIGPKNAGRGGLALAETALWLAGPLTRGPGVPIHADLPLAHGSRLASRSGHLLAGTRWGRNGANIVRVECAAAHDLAGAPYAQLSRAQGWKDHEDHSGRPAGASSAKRAVRQGRKLLHLLGAWPWAHVPDGRLHEQPDWWHDSVFLNPLRTWLAHSWARLLFNEVARHRNAIAAEPAQGATASVSRLGWELLQEVAGQVVVALDADRLIETLGKQPTADSSDEGTAQR